MRFSSLLGLVAASAVQASVCKPSPPSSSSSVSPSASPSPSTVPCNANQLVDRSTGVSYASSWQYKALSGVQLSFPESCMNDSTNRYPDEDTYLYFDISVMASATTTTVTCILTVDTTIDFTLSSFYLRKICN